MSNSFRRSLTTFLLLALALAGLAALVQAAQAYFTAGVAYGTAALHTYPNVPANRYGANAFLEDDVYDWQLQRDFQALHDAGFGWVRQEFLWDQIEPGAKGNHYDAKNQVDAWAKWDRIVSDAQQYHIQIIARLDFAPAWATAGNPDSGKCPTLCPPPNNPQDFADFAGAVAQRYKGKVHYYQLWNEPNLEHDWAGRPISPAEYTALLKAGYEAIKAADPSASVISASLAPNRGDSPNNMSDLAFLRGMYAAGAKSYFDVLGAQAYGLDTPAYNRQLGPHSYQFPRALLPGTQPFTFDRPLQLRQIMLANGDGNRPIWVTEFGWISLPPNWRGNPSPWSEVSQTERVQSTIAAWQRAAAEWPWMGILNVWYLRDPVPADPRDPTPYFAILQPDWQPTPLYTAIKAQATAPPSAATGLHGATDPAAIYGPYGFAEAWQTQTQDGQAVRVAGAPGANMGFTFTGNALYVSVAKGPDGGEARITVDQVPGLANLLPADANGDRILDTYAPRPEPPTLVPIASGLPDARHSFNLEVLPAHNPAAKGTDIALAGFGVTVEKPAIWSYLDAGLAAAALFLLLWPAVGVVRRGPSLQPLPQFWGRGLIVQGPTTASRTDGLGGVQHAGRAWQFRSPQRWGASSVQHAVHALRFLSPRIGGEDRREGFLPLLVWAAGLCLFYLPAQLASSAAGGAVLVVMGLLRPDLGLLLLPAVLPLEFLPKHLGSAELTLNEVVIGVCALGWVVRCYWQRRLLLERGPATMLARGLLVAGLASLFAAAYPRYSLRDYRQVIVEPVLYLIMVTALLKPGQVGRLLGWAVGAGAAVALLALAGYAVHRGGVAVEGVVRLAGPYPSPDNLALYLERALALAGGMALWSAGRRRLLLVLACLPMALAVFLTFSKGAWVALVVTAALIGLALSWRMFVVALAAAAAVVLAALYAGVRRLSELFQFGANSTTGRRLLLWRASWHMARQHPIQGIGLDNFLYQYPRYRLPGAESEPFLSHPHNLILDFWLSLGLLGLLWLGWAVVTVVGLVRQLGGSADPGVRAMALGLVASLLVAAWHGLVDNSYFLPDLAVLFWLAVGGLQLLAWQASAVEDATMAGVGDVCVQS